MTIDTSHDNYASSSDGNDGAIWFWEYAATKAPANDNWYYVRYSLLAIAYFFTLHFLIHQYYNRYRNQVYISMNTQKQTEYRTYILSIMHAIVCVYLSATAMWNICEDGKTVFDSQECMMTVRYIHVWALLHTCGYFLTDFFFLFFVIKGDSALDYQTYAHHLVAVTTFY